MRLLSATPIVLLLASSLASAQSASPIPPGNLELRLHPASIEDGIPQAFTFEIANRTNHDVRVPQPVVDCAGDYTGYIWLRMVFTPLHSRGSEIGYMCAADKVNWPPILKRVREWKVLRPGETVSQTVARAQLHYEGRQPGSYEFWAEYHPPAIEPEDQKALGKAGVDFPHGQLTSSHLTFTRKP